MLNHSTTPDTETDTFDAVRTDIQTKANISYLKAAFL